MDSPILVNENLKKFILAHLEVSSKGGTGPYYYLGVGCVIPDRYDGSFNVFQAMTLGCLVETISAPHAEQRRMIPGKKQEVFLALSDRDVASTRQVAFKQTQAEDARRNQAAQ